MPEENIQDHPMNRDEVSKKASFDNFRNRSGTAQEIISRKPGFTEKWALFIFGSIMLLLFAGTWFIRYPEIVQTRATLSADNGPKEIIPLQSGRLIQLFVHNGDSIKQGNMLCWIESTANPYEVLKLSQQLDSSIILLSQGKAGKLPALFSESFQNLGAIQSSYQTYVTALQQFDDHMVNGFYNRQKSMILNNMASINEMNQALQKQKELNEQDNQLSNQTFRMHEQLYKDKVISPEEYRQAQSVLLNKQMLIPQINSSLLSNQNQQRDKLKELQQLEHDLAQQKTTFEQALQTLKSNVDDWKRQYIILAPIDGIISFSFPVQENQFIEQGKLLGYINPPASKFYAQLYLPQGNLGKVDTGMKVQLRFDAYPYQEAGFVEGKLSYISRVVSDSGYLSIVKMNNGLQTNQHKTLQYKNGLKADALVVTKDMRLLQRLYYHLVKTTSIGN